MPKYNANNERIKREFFIWLREAKRQSDASVDAASMAIRQFETDTNFRDFKQFNVNQVTAFKRRLADRQSQATGKKLSKATLHSTFAHLKRFFLWLAGQHGYKSHLKYSDAEYFNFSEKGSRVATANREMRAPTIEQLQFVLRRMPADSEIELRDRAIFAFIMLSGARVNAAASLKLKHIDQAEGCVFQDAREVRTKFSKTFKTVFIEVGKDARNIFDEWINYLRVQKHWGDDDPLFPSTKTGLNSNNQFEVVGIDRIHWRTTGPIREIFRQAFEAANLPYFNPHSFRATLTKLGQLRCRTPEEFKAWSQNLGHERVMTTFTSYGEVSTDRQYEIIRSLNLPKSNEVRELTAKEIVFLEALQLAGV